MQLAAFCYLYPEQGPRGVQHMCDQQSLWTFIRNKTKVFVDFPLASFKYTLVSELVQVSHLSGWRDSPILEIFNKLFRKVMTASRNVSLKSCSSLFENSLKLALFNLGASECSATRWRAVCDRDIMFGPRRNRTFF